MPANAGMFLVSEEGLVNPDCCRSTRFSAAGLPFFQISSPDYPPPALEAFFFAFRLAGRFFALRLAFFLALRLAFFLAFFLVFLLAAFFFVLRLAAFFFVLRFVAFFFVARRLATFRFAFFRVTLRFFTTLRLEAFLRDIFLVAINFSVSGTRR